MKPRIDSPRGRVKAQQPPRQEPEWATAIARGDETAFEALFHAYYDRLPLFALRFVPIPEVAEEIVATVFMRVWQLRERMEIRESLQSYLYTSVRNYCLMHLQHLNVVERVHDAAARAQRSPAMGQSQPAADDALQA